MFGTSIQMNMQMENMFVWSLKKLFSIKRKHAFLMKQ